MESQREGPLNQYGWTEEGKKHFLRVSAIAES